MVDDERKGVVVGTEESVGRRMMMVRLALPAIVWIFPREIKFEEALALVRGK